MNQDILHVHISDTTKGLVTHKRKSRGIDLCLIAKKDFFIALWPIHQLWSCRDISC